MKGKYNYSLYRVLMLTFLILIFGSVELGYADGEFIDVSIGSFSNKLSIGGENELVVKDLSGNILECLGAKFIEVELAGKYLVLYDKTRKLSSYNTNEIMLGTESGLVEVNKRKYRGDLILKASGKIVNHLDIEEYLYGVVPREMGASFPVEALKAQAVASRSFALSNKNKHKSEGFNLCNTTHCQVYSGYSSENKKINEIIEATRGQYVYYNGNIAETVFHSNNGGYIESARGAWGNPIAYLQSKEDRFSEGTVNSDWSFEISIAELNNKLNKAGIKIGSLKDLEIVGLTDGKRATSIRLIGSTAEEVIPASKFRTILGNNNFKSTYFTINGRETLGVDKNLDLYVLDGLEIFKVQDSPIYVEGRKGSLKENLASLSIYGRTELDGSKPSGLTSSTLKIKGKGFGHGVGMSQYGAKAMAEAGYDYLEILEYYYEGTEIY